MNISGTPLPSAHNSLLIVDAQVTGGDSSNRDRVKLRDGRDLTGEQLGSLPLGLSSYLN